MVYYLKSYTSTLQSTLVLTFCHCVQFAGVVCRLCCLLWVSSIAVSILMCAMPIQECQITTIQLWACLDPLDVRLRCCLLLPMSGGDAIWCRRQLSMRHAKS